MSEGGDDCKIPNNGLSSSLQSSLPYSQLACNRACHTHTSLWRRVSQATYKMFKGVVRHYNNFYYPGACFSFLFLPVPVLANVHRILEQHLSWFWSWRLPKAQSFPVACDLFKWSIVAFQHIAPSRLPTSSCVRRHQGSPRCNKST